MKASELRLGNYVNVPIPEQCPFRIDEFECLTYEFIKVGQKQIINGKEVHPFTWYGADLEPIPLTEEWLLKFGLKYSYNDKNRFFMLGVDIYIFNADKIVFNPSSTFLSVKLDYVHQLQNLYFSLTGKELTLKP